MRAKESPPFPPLEAEDRPAVDTAAAAHYLNRRPQTLRGWACLENGPIRPIRIHGRLAWPVAEIKRVRGDDAMAGARDTSGAGFPHGARVEPGVSLRDYFAAKAMQALIAKPPVDPAKRPTLSDVVKGAYIFADGMLEARGV